MKKNSIGSIFAASLILAAPLLAMSAANALAATNKTAFDPVSGELTVTGNCSSRFVLVIIRRAADGSIWGSSNPECVKGTYEYAITVPPDERSGKTFIVDVAEGNAPAAPTPASVTTVKPVDAPVPQIDANAITIDAASLAVAPEEDLSFVDAALARFFGTMAAIADAVKSTVVAAVHLFTKTLAILPNGSITVPRGANQIAGESALLAGASEIFIHNTLVSSSTEIMITPTSPTEVPLAVLGKVDGSGFRVGVARTQSSPVTFGWLLLQTYEAASSSITEQTISFLPSGAPTVSAQPPDTAPAVVDEPAPEDTSPAPSSTIDASSTPALDVSTTTPEATPPDSSPPADPPADPSTENVVQ